MESFRARLQAGLRREVTEDDLPQATDQGHMPIRTIRL
jgi:hypothetical protein